MITIQCAVRDRCPGEPRGIVVSYCAFYDAIDRKTAARGRERVVSTTVNLRSAAPGSIVSETAGTQQTQTSQRRRHLRDQAPCVVALFQATRRSCRTTTQDAKTRLSKRREFWFAIGGTKYCGDYASHNRTYVCKLRREFCMRH